MSLNTECFALIFEACETDLAHLLDHKIRREAYMSRRLVRVGRDTGPLWDSGIGGGLRWTGLGGAVCPVADLDLGSVFAGNDVSATEGSGLCASTGYITSGYQASEYPVDEQRIHHQTG